MVFSDGGSHMVTGSRPDSKVPRELSYARRIRHVLAGLRPQAPRERLRTRVTPAWLPHTIHLCIHCGANPAGFWVSRADSKTVRRPWCLSCCEGLDRDRYGVIPFDS
jgi:hypothetical protein